jgi:hypothetical protein
MLPLNRPSLKRTMPRNALETSPSEFVQNIREIFDPIILIEFDPLFPT